MTDRYDVLIIGGGHNGLVCAAYLAKAGRKVLVLERSDQPGGAAITREFAPGFRVSACAHILHMLQPKVIRDLNLKAHGLDLRFNHPSRRWCQCRAGHQRGARNSCRSGQEEYYSGGLRR